MATDALVQPQVYMGLGGGLWNAPVPAGLMVSNADIVRSEENILRWMTYLPQDCIETMIRMGWDVTT
jgi:hypothetical protein